MAKVMSAAAAYSFLVCHSIALICLKIRTYPRKRTLAGGEYAVGFVPDVDSGFVDAKHIQLPFVNLAAHSSVVIGSSLIA